MAASSDAGYLMSDRATTPRRFLHPSSSAGARPRAPPSEGTTAISDDETEGFADDQIPRSSRIQDPANIPKVEDKIGLMVQEHFEAFIEGYFILISFFSSNIPTKLVPASDS